MKILTLALVAAANLVAGAMTLGSAGAAGQDGPQTRVAQHHQHVRVHHVRRDDWHSDGWRNDGWQQVRHVHKPTYRVGYGYGHANAYGHYDSKAAAGAPIPVVFHKSDAGYKAAWPVYRGHVSTRPVVWSHGYRVWQPVFYKGCSFWSYKGQHCVKWY